jgi:hypothetical protein
MTEAPDVSPDAPEDDRVDEDGGVEGRAPTGGDADEMPTGDERVDAVLESLTGLDERPLAEHTAVFERAHERLREALDPDSGSGPAPDLRSA